MSRALSQGSFAARFYREDLRLVFPRTDTASGVTFPGTYGVVDLNPVGRAPIYWPENPDNAGAPLTPISLFHMGPGDRLALLLGGVAAAADDEMQLVVTRIDPVRNGAGVVVGFVERLHASLTGIRSNSTSFLQFANVMATVLDDVVAGDRPIGVWTLAAGSATFMGDASAPSAVFVESEQAAFMRVYRAVGDWDAVWCYGKRSGGQARPVWR